MSNNTTKPVSQAGTPNIRIRTRFGSFWTLNAVVETYTKAQAEEAIREFLENCAEAGMDYTLDDVEISIANAACVPASDVFQELAAA